jgi:hypothetical protein
LTAEFPPRPSHQQEINLLVELYRCSIEGRTAWYVSSPLTTGRKTLGWEREHEASNGTELLTDEAFRRQVLEPNRRSAARFVAKLRAKLTHVVIDPTALKDIAEWTQADYRVLWGSVIKRYAEVVIFRRGWEYSSGCAYELLTASSSGATMLREDLTAMGLEEARQRLLTAIVAIRNDGRSSEFLRGVVDNLTETVEAD